MASRSDTLSGAQVSNNSISSQSGNGIYFWDTNDSSFTANSISNIHTGTHDAWGIALDGSSAGNTINGGNDIHDADVGIWVSGNAANAAHGNSITNDTIGVENDGSTQFDATGNWWGNASGPNDTVAHDNSVYETNSTGTGTVAKGAVKYFPWCTDSSCTTLNNAIAPTLQSPANNSVLTNAGTLQWSDVPGAVGYEYDSSHSGSVDSHNKLSSPIYDRNNLTASQIDAHATAQGVYYWQARAKFADGSYGPWASPWKLTVDTTKPSTPQITAPHDGQYFSTQPILDSWTTATDNLSGVKNYQIAYHYDDGHSFGGTNTCPGLSMTGYSGFIGCRNVNGTSRNHTPALSEQGGVTIWVRAVDNAGNMGNWSNPVHYYYDTTSLAAPTLVSPHDEAVVNGASLTNSWGSVNNATKYEYESFNSSDTSHSPRYDHVYTSTSKTAHNVADGTVFYWRVRALDQYGKPGQWSALWKVTVDNKAPGKVKGVTIKVNGITVGCGASINQRNITVDWNNSSDPNFSYYQYQADSDKVSPYDYTTNVNTSERSGTIRDQDGTYNYRIRAIDKAGNIGAWSNWCSVTLDRQSPSTPSASIAGGSYTGSKLVQLTSTDPSPSSGLADIYYTTDGSAPTSSNGTPVSSGSYVLVNSSETIKAIAYDNAGNESGVMSETYTISSAALYAFIDTQLHAGQQHRWRYWHDQSARR